MSLPKQIQDLADEAERLTQEMAAEPAPEEPQATEEIPGEPGQEPSGEVEPQPTPEPEPAPQPETFKGDDAETWKKRYQTLQGMFNAEIPRLTAKITDLERQLETKAAAPEPKPAPIPTVTDKDVEAFGSDLIDLIKRQAGDTLAAAQSDFDARLAAKDAELAELRSQVSSVVDTQGNTALANYFADLATLVPDYEAVNVNPVFLDWLSQVDDVAGVPRQHFLNSAYEARDVQRTARLFNLFKNQTGKPPAPQAQAKEPPPELQRQVAPSGSRASSTPADSTTKIWSMREVDKFYRDVSKGLYRGKSDEQARIEAEIDLAVSQGRLRD